MSTSVCPKCGANLDASARFCASCGQAVSAPAGVTETPPRSPAPASGKKLPVLPLVIFGGGLVVLVGVLTFMRSNARSGGGAAPGEAPSVPSSGVPAAPASTVSSPVARPGAPATPAPPVSSPVARPGAPATPAASGLSFPDTLPAASSASPSSPGAPPDATVAGSRAPSAKSWKDPLASGDRPAAQPRQAPVGMGAAPGARRPSQPVPPKAPPVSRTYDCRESAIFNITPEDVHITVDGQPIGTADRWDGAGEGRKYVFRGPGIHYVKLSHERYETVWLKFDVSEDSIYRTGDVDLQMKKVSRQED